MLGVTTLFTNGNLFLIKILKTLSFSSKFSGMETTAKEKIETLKQEEEGMKSKLGDATLLASRLSYLRTNLQEYQEEINKEIEDINGNLIKMELTSKIDTIDFKAQLDAINKASDEVETISEKITEEIKTYEDSIEQLSGVERKKGWSN